MSEIVSPTSVSCTSIYHIKAGIPSSNTSLRIFGSDEMPYSWNFTNEDISRIVKDEAYATLNNHLMVNPSFKNFPFIFAYGVMRATNINVNVTLAGRLFLAPLDFAKRINSSNIFTNIDHTPVTGSIFTATSNFTRYPSTVGLPAQKSRTETLSGSIFSSVKAVDKLLVEMQTFYGAELLPTITPTYIYRGCLLYYDNYSSREVKVSKELMTNHYQEYYIVPKVYPEIQYNLNPAFLNSLDYDTLSDFKAGLTTDLRNTIIQRNPYKALEFINL